MFDIADLTSALGTASKFFHVLTLDGMAGNHIQCVIDNKEVRKSILDVINDALQQEAQNKDAEAAKTQTATDLLDARRGNEVKEELFREFLLQLKPDGSLNDQLDSAIALLSETHTSTQIIKALFTRIGGSSVVYHYGLDGGPKLTYVKIAEAYKHSTATEISKGAKRSIRQLESALKSWSGANGQFWLADSLVMARLVTPAWLPPDTTEEEMKAYRKSQITAWYNRASSEDNYSAEHIFANDGLILALGAYRRNVQSFTQLTEAKLREVRPEVAPYMDEIKATLAHYDLSHAANSISIS